MYQRILAPIDGSGPAQRAFDFALETARENGAELIPLYVVEVPIAAYQAPGFNPAIVRDTLFEEGERLKEETLAAMQRQNVKGAPSVVETAVPGGDIAECILEQARANHCDLVVMGTHGRHGVRRLMLGSVAERFLRMAFCPVLLIPGSIEGAAPAAAAAPSQTEKEPS